MFDNLIVNNCTSKYALNKGLPTQHCTKGLESIELLTVQYAIHNTLTCNAIRTLRTSSSGNLTSTQY